MDYFFILFTFVHGKSHEVAVFHGRSLTTSTKDRRCPPTVSADATYFTPCFVHNGHLNWVERSIGVQSGVQLELRTRVPFPDPSILVPLSVCCVIADCLRELHLDGFSVLVNGQTCEQTSARARRSSVHLVAGTDEPYLLVRLQFSC